MEILLVSKSKGSLGRIRIGVTLCVVLLLVLTAFAAAFSFAGYRMGEKQTAGFLLQNNLRLESNWQHEVAQQRLLIESAKLDAERGVDAIAARVGILQAHILRLDAVGARMVEKLGLDADGIQFDSLPGVGGQKGEQTGLEIGDFITALEVLSEELDDRESKLKLLESLYQRSQLSEQTTPSLRPVRKGWISSGFGKRTDPMTGKSDFHKGLDFAGPRGTEILAVADGIVTWSDRRYDYGNMVEIDHGNGYISRYSHNKKNLVSLGERVSKGQVIALLGSTGRSTGPHVHFEIVHNGKIVNPKTLIK